MQNALILKRIKVRLEIALNNIQAEEVHYLSEPVFSLGITPSIKSHLESHGILYIGDLIHLNDNISWKSGVSVR